MKLKLVVIDDEMFVRKGIISSVNWSEHDIEIAGEAFDGRSGLEVIRSSQPHIVITDIRMPNMDGLQLIRAAREEFPATQFLILSVLEEFQKVREAMQLGVVDYVPKLSMTPDELLKAVLKIKDQIVFQQNDPRQIGREESLGEEWMKWISGEPSRHFSLLLSEAKGFVMASVRCKPKNEGTYEFFPNEWVKALEQDGSEIIEKIHPSFIGKNQAAVLLVLNDKGQLDFLASAFERMIRRYREDFHLSVGLSLEYDQERDRMEAMKQAELAAEKRFYTGNGFVHLFTESSPDHSPPEFLHKKELADYFYALEQENDRLAEEACMMLFPERIEASFSQKIVRDGIYHWVSSLSLYVKERGGEWNQALGGDSPFDLIHQIDTYPDLRDWCLRLHTVAISMLQSLRNMQRHEVLKAMDYTKNNYMNAIRIKEVADLVHLSESYFSYVFTNETGQTFSQYLLGVRLDKAKELLQLNDCSWIEAGERVGFENPKYFTKVFKRYTGVTPKQFADSRK